MLREQMLKFNEEKVLNKHNLDYYIINMCSTSQQSHLIVNICFFESVFNSPLSLETNDNIIVQQK